MTARERRDLDRSFRQEETVYAVARWGVAAVIAYALYSVTVARKANV